MKVQRNSWRRLVTNILTVVQLYKLDTKIGLHTHQHHKLLGHFYARQEAQILYVSFTHRYKINQGVMVGFGSKIWLPDMLPKLNTFDISLVWYFSSISQLSLHKFKTLVKMVNSKEPKHYYQHYKIHNILSPLFIFYKHVCFKSSLCIWASTFSWRRIEDLS